ncbi:glycosyltransferase family 4 protein [Methylomonas sp. HW2-6]|uniref:glycosyltransferase family 4 protein n=1 Tax=Methylomonas sp. HW2-6 TaxID=3376687 RepID=UPI004042A0EC
MLGKGTYNPRARTGIFRVIENLAIELTQRNYISLFCATQNIGSYFESIDYLASNELLSEISLAKPKISQQILTILQDAHTYKYNHKINTQILGLAKRLLIISANNLFQSYAINDNDLRNAEIFHSPFYPVPSFINRHSRIKKVITIHDLIPILYPEFFQFKENSLIHNVVKSISNDTWITCTSQSTKYDLCNYLPALDPNKVHVTHLGASKLFYQCKDEVIINNVKIKFGIPDSQYILSLSTLEPRKNIKQTIRCFARILAEERINDLVLVLAGTKGWDFTEIFDEINANPSVRDKIIFTGYIPDEDLAPLYNGAIMFVYPSFYEGFGLPPLEAMQCGIPVITSNTSSLPEVVGNAGIMIPPDDADSLCQAMLSIYKSSDLREQMSKSSLKQANKFSWEACAEKTINAYQAAITQ